MQTDIDLIWRHVEFLAAEPRPAESTRLEECRQYCEQYLQSVGWQTDRSEFRVQLDDGQQVTGINLIAQLTSTTADNASNELQQTPRKTFIVGAHLDSKPETPGADDNASAVAVLLEVARLVAATSHGCIVSEDIDLQLVCFDLEELGMLGGAFHADCCTKNNTPVAGMVSLEMLGYCDHSPGSQSLPPEIEGMYPDVADFIAVVGNQNSGNLIQHFVTHMSEVKSLPVESLQVPDNGLPLPPTRLSDHSPFWDAGFPALMITDTSFMRNPHYHLASDTPETLDKEFLHKVAEGVLKAVHSV